MKDKYQIKDKVWIHLGEHKLVEGRIVEIIDFSHLNEDHDPDREFYVIEIKTGIEDIYEVREFDTISPDEQGPVNLFRSNQAIEANRFLKKVGVKLPTSQDTSLDQEYDDEYDEPTDEQIVAAIERAQQIAKIPKLEFKENKPRRRYYKRKKKVESKS